MFASIIGTCDHRKTSILFVVVAFFIKKTNEKQKFLPHSQNPKEKNDSLI